jgi:hypothetical protein
MLLCCALIAPWAVAQEMDDSMMGFGFGGPSIGIFLPDLTGVNAFLEDNGYAALDGLMITAGGRGRGGVIGGVSAGGLGWGGAIETGTGTSEAGLAMGFGGIELGHVAGGDEQSLLTVGFVLGGGGASLTVRGIDPFPPPCPNQGPQGCIPTPEDYSMGRFFLAVQPFISMQVQPLGFLGFELHVGWIIPLLGFEWCDAPLDVGGRPILELGGPTLGFSLTWGGIGAAPAEDDASATTRHIVPLTGDCVEIENPVGLIEVTTVEAGSVQTASGAAAEIVVTRNARSAAVREQIAIDIGDGECGLRIATDGPRRWGWSVDYEVTLPHGTELRINQGAGDVRLEDYWGEATVELGAGAIEIDGFHGDALGIDLGVGDVTIAGVVAEDTTVRVGTGDADIFVGPDASLRVEATTGVGEVSIGPFPGVPEAESSGFGSDLAAQLGDGARSLSVNVGVGSIAVSPEED